ncbi:MAG: hypothetical protein HYZ29_16120 [Myxococcales bacterium]|nr:hypothetical protein [Myxococcales bacterium]
MRAIQLLAFFAAGSAALGACGGKTQIDATGGSAGSSGGGSGGSSGGGTAGISGGTAGSGAFGGMAGSGAFGGMAGSAGTGATGGVAGGGGSSSIWQKVDQVCKVISTLPCAMPGCKKEIGESVMMAQDEGCLPELENILDCALTYPMTCKGGDPDLAPQCDKATYLFEECVSGSSSCSGWGGSDGSCGIKCNEFDASCKPLPGGGGVQCACNSGPEAGKLFKLPMTCSSPNLQDALSANCG